MKLHIFIDNDVCAPFHSVNLHRSVNYGIKNDTFFTPNPQKESLVQLDKDGIIEQLKENASWLVGDTIKVYFNLNFAIYNNGNTKNPIVGKTDYTSPAHRADRAVSELIITFDNLGELYRTDNCFILHRIEISNIQFIATHPDPSNVSIYPLEIPKDELFEHQAPSCNFL